MNKKKEGQRKGRWHNPIGTPDTFPLWVRAALNEPDPDWDWKQSAGWIVVRQFHEGREDARVVAKVMEVKLK